MRREAVFEFSAEKTPRKTISLAFSNLEILNWAQAADHFLPRSTSTLEPLSLCRLICVSSAQHASQFVSVDLQGGTTSPGRGSVLRPVCLFRSNHLLHPFFHPFWLPKTVIKQRFRWWEGPSSRRLRLALLIYTSKYLSRIRLFGPAPTFFLPAGTGDPQAAREGQPQQYYHHINSAEWRSAFLQQRRFSGL